MFFRNFKVDNSSLTGEGRPQRKSPACTSTNPLETENLAFFSTSVVEGSACGMVVTIGDSTVMGRIAELADSIKCDETPLSSDLNNFIKVMTWISFRLDSSKPVILLYVIKTFVEIYLDNRAIFHLNRPHLKFNS